jgi:Protein of unknown function (DUF1559)
MTVPFKIRCGSCKVVLTIKNQKLVGKRIACPKCKSPLIIKTPAPPGKKPKKPASSQSIILEDQDDEYSDDGFANALSGTVKTSGSSKKSSGSKSQVLKRRSSSSGSIDSYDDDYDDEFEDDEFEDDDEFLSDDEVPVAKSRKKASKKSGSQNKFVIPAIVAVGILVLGGIGYSFMGGSSAVVTPANKIGSDQKDDQQEEKAPSAPKSKAGKPTNDEAENNVAVKSDEEDSDEPDKKPGKKSKSNFSRKPLKKLKSSVVSKSSSKINLAYLYKDSEALIRIDMQKIMDSEFVQNLLSSSDTPPIPEDFKDMESITIGIKGLSEVSKMAQTGGLSPATMMMPNQALSKLKTITVVRYSSEIDLDKLLTKSKQKNPAVTIASSEIDFEDHIIHVVPAKMPGQGGKSVTNESAICFIDERTMITGQLEDVQYAIKNAGVNISRTSEFNNSKYESQQFVAIFAPDNPEKFFTSLGDSEAEEESGEPSEGGMSSVFSSEMFKDLVSVSIGASFSDSIDIKSHIKAENPEATKNYEQMLNMLVQVGTSQLQAQASSAPEQFKEIYSLGEDLLRRIDFSLDEEELDINLQLVESDIDTFKKLPGLVMMMMMQQSIAGGGGPSKSPGGFSPGGKSSISKNNLKQIGLAFHNFHDVYNGLPTAYIVDSEEKPGLSWRVSLLPFLDEKDLYEQFDLDKPWDDSHNLALADQMPAIFQSATHNLEPNQTKFRVVSDESTAISPETNNSFPSFTDGTSSTVMVLEVDDENATIWTKPDSIENSDKVLKKLRDNNPTFISLFADGTVRRIMPFELEELKMLLTRNGGEVISENLLTSNNEGKPQTPKTSPKKPAVKEKKKVPTFKGGFSPDRGKRNSSPRVKIVTPNGKSTTQPSTPKKTAPKKVSSVPKKKKASPTFLKPTEAKTNPSNSTTPKIKIGGSFGFGGRNNRSERGNRYSKKPVKKLSIKKKKKSNFLKGDDEDSEETDVDVQELIDEGATIKKDEDGNVVWLKMTGPKVKDETLEKISQISTLEHLILTKTSMTDEGLSHLSELAGLEKLILTQNNITDDGIDALTEISSLTNLAIKKTKITKTGARKLSEELSDCKVLH